MAEAKIRIRGLTKLDKLDLGNKPGIEYSEAKLDSSSQGEVTLFTAVVTMSLISTLAAYLLRTHQGQSFEKDVEIVHPDGRIEHRHIKWKSHKSEAPEAEIVAQIRGDSF